MEINAYCDESCHLEHDGQRAMVLGTLQVPLSKAAEIATRIREIKLKHGVSARAELKWTKASPAKHAMYLEVIDYFFDDDDLQFRAVIVPDKSKLRHDKVPGQDHDSWYYKMYFILLKEILAPGNIYRIYLDIKDTRGAAKVQKLKEILHKNSYDFKRQMINRVQVIRSHEVQALQLADVLIGAVGYVNREIKTPSATKQALIDRIKHRSGYSLTKTTLQRERKFNIFRWEPQEF